MIARTRPDSRQQGRIEERGQSLRVVVYAGLDPVTGRRSYLRETISGTDDKSWRKAENKLTEFRARIIKQRTTVSSVKLSFAIDEWLRTADIEQSTRDGYVGYIDRVVKPILGATSVSKIGNRELENLYAQLRRCRKRCDGKPFIEKHEADGEHDCVASKCQPHECRPMAASTVRQIPGVVRGGDGLFADRVIPHPGRRLGSRVVGDLLPRQEQRRRVRIPPQQLSTVGVVATRGGLFKCCFHSSREVTTLQKDQRQREQPRKTNL